MLDRTLRGTVGLLCVASVLAQDWRGIGPAGGWAAAYDEARREILAVDRATFATDGSGWRQVPGSLVPVGWILCHDPGRARTIAFNAINPNQLQTFEWDGVAWQARSTVLTPALHLVGQAPLVAAYDRQRGAVLVCGVASNVSQTWALDGTGWQLVATSGPTNVGGFGGMAYDEARGVMLMAAICWVNSAWSFEFWEWNGAQWNPRSFGVAPSSGTSMAYDPVRQRTVLVSSTGTWEFDASLGGGTWQQISTTPVYYPAIFFARHRGRVVSVNGSGLDEWTGQSWVSFLTPLPSYSGRMQLRPASGRVVSFGYSYSAATLTAEFDGFGWHEILPAVSPPARRNHSLWNDGHDVWLFGGEDAIAGLFNDTWRWDGQNWSPVITAQTPSPRHGVAIAYDSLRQRAVAFGGATALNNVASGTAETWEFDGATWLQRTPANAPPARSYAASAYDPIAARTMICLGDLATGYRAIDAWQWDGQQWSVAPPVNAYSWIAGQQHDLAFDPIAGRLLLAQLWGYSFDLREFTGTAWVSRPAPPYLQPGYFVQLVADKDRNLLLSAGGGLFRRMITNSVATRFGSGCIADLMLSPRTYPKLGAASGIEVVGAPPNGPVLLLAADSTMSLPLGNGCTQLVTHTQWTFFTLADAYGTARLPFAIPDDVALRGYQLNFQALTLAAVAPGFAMSAGLQLTLGD